MKSSFNSTAKKIMEEDLFKKNKTRKLKPTLEIVGDEEEVVEVPEEVVEVPEAVVEVPESEAFLEGGMGPREEEEEEEKELTLPIKFEGNSSEEKYYDSEDDK
jgi:hypothetical protein